MPAAGIEPARLAAGDFESLNLGVYTRQYQSNQHLRRIYPSLNASAAGRLLEARTAIDSGVASASLDVMVLP